MLTVLTDKENETNNLTSNSKQLLQAEVFSSRSGTTQLTLDHVFQLMAFFAFFVPCRRIFWILILSLVGSCFSGFLLATALHSPNMLLGSTVGGALTVSSLFSLCLQRL